jgi:hypothetical protein
MSNRMLKALSDNFRESKIKYHRRMSEKWDSKWCGEKFSFHGKTYCRDRSYYHWLIVGALTLEND